MDHPQPMPRHDGALHLSADFALPSKAFSGLQSVLSVRYLPNRRRRCKPQVLRDRTAAWTLRSSPHTMASESAVRRLRLATHLEDSAHAAIGSTW